MVMVEMDSRPLLDVLHRHARCPWRIDAFVRQVWNTVQGGQFYLSHNYREVNAAADALARQASANRESNIYCARSLPDLVKGLVNLDRLSFPYMRIS